MNETEDDENDEKGLENDSSVEIRDVNTSSLDNRAKDNDNAAKMLINILQGNFVSKKVVKLSRWNLTDSEISLLAKGLDFVPNSNRIDKTKLKMELETLGRILRWKWLFKNEENEFDLDQFKPKSSFNPRDKEAATEVYMSSLEEKLMKIKIAKDKYNNLTSKEQQVVYDLKKDKNIVVKGAGKGFGVVVWDRGDYIKEVEKQLGDCDINEEVPDGSKPLISTIHRIIKVRKGENLKKETIKYVEVKDPKFATFYLLPKIYKQLNNVPGRSLTSSGGYYTENISAFLDFHLQPLGQAINSYIKDTNDFPNKLCSLPKLLVYIILCTVDVVGLHLNIPHEEGLSDLRKRLDETVEKYISNNTLFYLAEVVLKEQYF